jgi:type II secretory pathway pseudopilin PulG
MMLQMRQQRENRQRREQMQQQQQQQQQHQHQHQHQQQQQQQPPPSPSPLQQPLPSPLPLGMPDLGRDVSISQLLPPNMNRAFSFGGLGGLGMDIEQPALGNRGISILAEPGDASWAADAMPELLRTISSSSGGGGGGLAGHHSIHSMPSLLRTISAGVGGGAAAAGFEAAAAAVERQQQHGSVQQDVCLVVAKKFVLGRSAADHGGAAPRSLGMPAFDRRLKLVGFYDEDHHGTVAVNFEPLAQLRVHGAALSPQETERCERAAAAEVKAGTECVFKVADDRPLSKLIEDAMLFVWSSTIDVEIQV